MDDADDDVNDAVEDDDEDGGGWVASVVSGQRFVIFAFPPDAVFMSHKSVSPCDFIFRMCRLTFFILKLQNMIVNIRKAKLIIIIINNKTMLTKSLFVFK